MAACSPGERGLQSFELGHEAFAFFFGVRVVASWVSAAAIIASRRAGAPDTLAAAAAWAIAAAFSCLARAARAADDVPATAGALPAAAVTPAVSLSLAR